jgi:hypothetical protein
MNFSRRFAEVRGAVTAGYPSGIVYVLTTTTLNGAKANTNEHDCVDRHEVQNTGRVYS